MAEREATPSSVPAVPVVPDHTLIRRIGGGSYGEVWLARNIVGTHRAVKIVRRSSFDHERPYEREFTGIRNFEPISRSHDGLVDILQLGRNDEQGYFYYIMEVADDAAPPRPDAPQANGSQPDAGYEPKTLRTELKRRSRLPVSECAEVGVRIAGALSYLHTHGLVHRDLKPSNVIYVNGAPKLADIGLVAGLGETRSYVGTEGFIPPEGPGTAQGDVYGLGKLLYEVGTGKDSNAFPELPPGLKDVSDSGCFADLNEIILKACAPDRRLRYQTAAQMEHDLGLLIRGGSIRARRRHERFWKRAKVALLAACLLIALTAVGFFAWRSMQPPALSFASRDFLLVTDFANQTGNAIFDRSLWTAFTVSLQQSQHANVFPRARIADALKRMGKPPDAAIDEPLGREICQRENVRALVVCDISSTGGNYVLSSRLVDPRNATTVRAYQEYAASHTEVIEALGQMAVRLRKDLGESLASIGKSDRPLAFVTTQSLEALKSYSDGLYLWEKGSYREAVKSYEAALARDPNFAMANEALGSAYYSHIFGEQTKGKAYYERALRDTDRVTERERLYIQASYARALGHFDEAAQLHRLYLTIYPDDTGMRYSFATMLMLHGRLPEAAEQFEETLRIAPTKANALINLATTYYMLDRSEDALPLYSKAFQVEPALAGQPNLVDEYGFTLAAAGQISKAREVLQAAAAKPSTAASALRSLALLDLYQGKYRDAEKRLKECLIISQARQDLTRLTRTHIFYAILWVGRGDRAATLAELDRAAASVEADRAPQNSICVRVGIGYARAGAIGKSEAVLRRLKPRVDVQSEKDRSYLHLLEGEIELARGHGAKALDALLLADRESSTPETIASAAHAYDRTGDRDRAIEYYGKLILKTRPAMGWEPQQPWIEAHARLAELQLSAGNNVAAADALRPLLGLWENADSDLPLRKTITSLQHELRARQIAF